MRELAVTGSNTFQKRGGRGNQSDVVVSIFNLHCQFSLYQLGEISSFP